MRIYKVINSSQIAENPSIIYTEVGVISNAGMLETLLISFRRKGHGVHCVSGVIPRTASTIPIMAPMMVDMPWTRLLPGLVGWPCGGMALVSLLLARFTPVEWLARGEMWWHNQISVCAALNL